MIQTTINTLVRSRATSVQEEVVGNISKELYDVLFEKGYKQRSLDNLKCCGVDSGELLIICPNHGSRLINTHYCCNKRTCYNCSKKRQRKLFRQFHPYLMRFPKTYVYRFRFLTISIPNQKTLEEAHKIIRKGWRNFLRSNYSLINIVGDNKGGGFYIIETTNHNKGFHMHLHILLYSRYLQNRVINGEDSPLVSALKKSFKVNVNVDIRDISDSRKEVLLYTLKYVTSFKDNFDNLEDFADYIIFSHSKRLINTFGCFYDNPAPKLEPVCWLCGEKLNFCRDRERIEIFKIQQSLYNPT